MQISVNIGKQEYTWINIGKHEQVNSGKHR